MSNDSLPTKDATEWTPSVNPWLIAASVMLATFLEALDTSVANVALPQMAGSMASSLDEATWVLTSYLVANAIVLPMTGWLSAFFGRKRFLIACAALFTASSMACGMATSMGMLVLFRVVQGAVGGALLPISQAILLESFPPAKRGAAMAVYGIGVVVAPIIGPVLGGWITDNYSWRWIFYINLPLGILAVVLLQAFIEDPPYLRAAHKRQGKQVDFIGFVFMAIWLGLQEVILDRGQQDDWFNASWICWATWIAGIAAVLFIYKELRVASPLVNLRVFKDRNFALGTFLITIVGIVLYSTTALLPLFLQSLMGYPAFQSGIAIAPRGVGAVIGLVLAGLLANVVDNRLLIGFAFGLLAYACFLYGNINLDIATVNVMWPNVIAGLAMSMSFVPLTTISMGGLANEEMGNASGICNLARNVGGSIGISMATTMVARGTQAHQSLLAEHMSPYNPVFQQYVQTATSAASQYCDPVTAQHKTYGLLYGLLQQQANLFAYVDTFRFLAMMCMLCIILVFFLKKVKSAGGPTMMH